MAVSYGASGGVAYHDVSPRIPVTAYTLAGTCWRCSWAVRATDSGPEWHLKAVHAACPEHRELSRASQYQPQLARSNGGPATRPPSAPLSVPTPQIEALAAELADED